MTTRLRLPPLLLLLLLPALTRSWMMDCPQTRCRSRASFQHGSNHHYPLNDCHHHQWKRPCMNDEIASYRTKNDVANPAPVALISACAAIIMMISALVLLQEPAMALDHPVEHVLLGIPVPVADPRYFVAGGLCAAFSHGITVPIDVIKTKMQADPLKYLDVPVWGAAQVIWTENNNNSGVFLAGLGPTVLGYGIEGAAKFGLYESLKPIVRAFILGGSTAVPYLIASVLAGGAASLMLCPLERLRIRAVTDPTFPSSNVLLGASQLVQEEGVGSLFGGILAMLSKQVPYTIGKQVSFDVFAGLLYQAAARLSLTNVQAEISILAAFCASIMACVASHPGDVILTDTYKSSNSDIPQFTSVVKAIYELEGLNGFLAGLTARFLHVGAIITSQLVLYDFIKESLGLPATGS